MSTIESYRRNGKALLKKYPILLLILVAARLGMKFLLKFTDVEIPDWVMVVVFAVMVVCVGVLFVLDVVQREKKLRQMEQLEEEQSRKPIEAPTLAEYFDTYSEQTKQVLGKEQAEKRQMTSIEREESEQLDAANEESTTRWW